LKYFFGKREMWEVKVVGFLVALTPSPMFREDIAVVQIV
jgi:hypothetical protein